MRKTERRRAAETQSEELNFAPLQLGDSALNASAPPPAPKGRKTLAQGNALGPVAEDAPSAERAQEAELPVGWQFIPFTETICAARARVVKVQQSNYRESGRFPIIDQGQEFIAGYWDGEDDVYRDGLPVIVFGDHTRIFKFVDFPFVAGADGTHVLVPDRSRFEPFFLYLALSSLDIPSRGYNRHFRLLKERSIVTPPLPEQRGIAAVLRTVQCGKDACERVLAAMRQLKQSLLHHLFTYGPVPFPQAANVPRKETEIGPMPEHWDAVQLGTVANVRTSTSPVSSIPRATAQPGGRRILFLKVSDLNHPANQRRVVTSAAAFSVDDESERALKLVPEGAIVLPKRGAAIATNKKRLTTCGCLLDPNLVAVIPGPQLVSDYLYAWFERFDLRTITDTTTLPQINKKDLEPLQIPLPPLPEQREIAAQLAAVDAKLAAEESRRSALVALFQSLLQHLMTGKVRLPEFAKAPL